MTSLLLIGCGKMGSALLERWKASSAIAYFDIIDPSHTQKNESKITWHKNLTTLPVDYAPHIIVLAIKPQQLDAALPEYRIRFSGQTPLFISIAAGKKLDYYQKHLGEHVHIVRAMPNTPALVGHGVTVLTASETLPASARKIAGDLMKAVGKIEWLDDESLMDAVTAISGCGPAYVFLFLESLTQAGINAGLLEGLAKNLAVQTVAGSLVLAESSSKSFQQLCMDVASPGGATEAALSVLMKDDGIKNLLGIAVAAAEKRSKELS